MALVLYGELVRKHCMHASQSFNVLLPFPVLRRSICLTVWQVARNTGLSSLRTSPSPQWLQTSCGLHWEEHPLSWGWSPLKTAMLCSVVVDRKVNFSNETDHEINVLWFLMQQRYCVETRGASFLGSCYQLHLFKITPATRGPEHTDRGHIVSQHRECAAHRNISQFSWSLRFSQHRYMNKLYWTDW